MRGTRTALATGWDSDLPPGLIAKLPPGLKHTLGVQEVAQYPDGRAWWAKEAITLVWKFDPTAGSTSMKKLDAFATRHGIRLSQ